MRRVVATVAAGLFLIGLAIVAMTYTPPDPVRQRLELVQLGMTQDDVELTFDRTCSPNGEAWTCSASKGATVLPKYRSTNKHAASSISAGRRRIPNRSGLASGDGQFALNSHL